MARPKGSRNKSSVVEKPKKPIDYMKLVNLSDKHGAKLMALECKRQKLIDKFLLDIRKYI